jgi:hypothetical protein
MKYFLSEKQLKVIEESWKKKEEDPIATHIRKCLKDVYKPLGFWGSIQNPDNNCETGEGVIRAYPHLAGEDEWSILNRFDTNTKVRDRIKQIFLEKNPGQELTSSSLIDFIENNKKELFNGDYTDELVELNKSTIESGNRNEKFAIDVLKKYFGDTGIIKRFCSGDVRDTLKGMDLSVEVGSGSFHVQVKPFEEVKSYVDEENADTYFQLKTYYNPSKYSEKNVDIIFFVNFDSQKYILFANNKKYIVAKSTNSVAFYEPYLLTNIEFNTQYKKRKQSKNKQTKKDYVKDLFKVNMRKLKDLEFKKEALEKLIQKEKKKLESIGQGKLDL